MLAPSKVQKVTVCPIIVALIHIMHYAVNLINSLFYIHDSDNKLESIVN